MKRRWLAPLTGTDQAAAFAWESSRRTHDRLPVRLGPDSPGMDKDAVKKKQEHGANDRRDKAGGIFGPVPTELKADEFGDECTGDA